MQRRAPHPGGARGKPIALHPTTTQLLTSQQEFVSTCFWHESAVLGGVQLAGMSLGTRLHELLQSCHDSAKIFQRSYRLSSDPRLS